MSIQNPAGPAPAIRPTEGRHSRFQTFSSLKYRDFRLLVTSTAFASAGNWVQQVTLGWLIYDMTESAFLVGALSGIRSLPFLFVGPLGGILADRMDRRKVLVATQSVVGVTAFLFALLVLFGPLEVWHLFAFSLLSGAGWAMSNPLRQALVANSVPKESLMNAIALNSAAFNLSRALGPVFGGALIALTGPATNFFLQALFYLAFIVTVLPLRISQDMSQSRGSSLLSSFRDGLRYAVQERTILMLIVIAIIPSFFIFPFTQGIMPVFAQEVLQAGPGGLGLLLGAGGAGAFIGTLVLASLGNVKGKGLLLLAAATATGLAMIFFAATTWLPLTMFALLVVGGF